MLIDFLSQLFLGQKMYEYSLNVGNSTKGIKTLKWANTLSQIINRIQTNALEAKWEH